MSELATPADARPASEEPGGYPGAKRPDRRRWVDSWGVRIATYEWGSADAPPLLLAHGGFDFAGTFDVFAPLLAAAGWRVVSWDHRGHGDSAHVALYSWDADVRDALAVLDSTTRDPVPFVGHSKGGAVLTQLVEACPHRASHLVNIDGIPARRPLPDVADHERTRMLAAELSGWLDQRQRAAGKERRPGSLDELARRRARMNPRLPHAWLRYIAGIGARQDADGWRWKIDAALRFGGFGPWRFDWSLHRMAGLPVPFLAILGLMPEEMGWGTTADSVRPYLPPGARLECFADSGHFVHVEKPREVAELVLDFVR